MDWLLANEVSQGGPSDCSGSLEVRTGNRAHPWHNHEGFRVSRPHRRHHHSRSGHLVRYKGSVSFGWTSRAIAHMKAAISRAIALFTRRAGLTGFGQHSMLTAEPRLRLPGDIDHRLRQLVRDTPLPSADPWRVSAGRRRMGTVHRGQSAPDVKASHVVIGSITSARKNPVSSLFSRARWSLQRLRSRGACLGARRQLHPPGGSRTACAAV